MATSIDRFFELKARGTNVRTEVLAGVTTFMTMAYIVFVNPGILSAAGVPFAGAATATALGAALMTLSMGLITNRPIALASGMGLNAVVTFSVIGFQEANVPWQVGMAVILIEGLVILVLVLTGLREAVMNAIPLNLKRAIGAGIGLFITFIGLNEGGIVRPKPITLVDLGDFSSPAVWVTLIGLVATMGLMAFRVKGDILWGILVAAVAALALGVATLPDRLVAAPDFGTFLAPFHTVRGGLAIAQVFTPTLLVAVFAIMLTDFFDTMGTVVAIGEQAGFVDEKGRVPGLRNILLVDSSAAAFGGLFGASSITSYVESAAGVSQGGRTGLTNVVTALLFAATAFLAPVIAMVGGGTPVPNADHYALYAGSGFGVPGGTSFLYPITASALIVVGFLMIGVVRDIPWKDPEEAFPAFLTLVGIPLTYSISSGIGLGFISYVAMKVLHRKGGTVHPLLYVVSIAFLTAFVLQAIR
jgi:AGZA family xanthine/uracil permease-like MFS transporter